LVPAWKEVALVECKQVIAVRRDLKMSRGKTAVQVAHGSLSSALAARQKEREWFDAWLDGGQKKVVVRVEDEAELRDLFKIARGKGLPAYLVQDAGLTELPPGTTTVLGIGPAPVSLIDQVTGNLKLLD
jgi:PTH2 family peptidyl-tRNA hydrolase